MKIKYNSQNYNTTKIYKRFFVVLLSSFSLLLSSCFNTSRKLSAHMDMVIRKAYYHEYILPNDPTALLEDVSYYQFLKRYPDNKKYVYLFAWDVFEDTNEWTLEANDHFFTFEHEVFFIAYRSNTKSFYSIDSAITDGLFTISSLSVDLEDLDIFITAS